MLSLSAIADTFIVQSNNSQINFSINKLLFISVDGTFTKFKGKIILEDEKISSITGRVDAKSINTDNEKRDKDLREEEYFNTTEYQYINFQAVSLNDKELEATITIKDITKKVKFQIDEIKSTGTKLTLKISSTVDRQDFMLNGPMSSIVSDKVEVSAILMAYVQ